MKSTIFSNVVLGLTILLLVAGCRTNRVGQVYQPGGNQLPPGQAKKVYGHQSAKAFAPGQRKKHATVGYPNRNERVAPGIYDQKGKPGKGGKGKNKKK